MQEVHILIRLPSGKWAHCKLGYFLFLPQGLNLVARTALEYLPTINDPFKHFGQILVIFLVLNNFAIIT